AAAGARTPVIILFGTRTAFPADFGAAPSGFLAGHAAAAAIVVIVRVTAPAAPAGLSAAPRDLALFVPVHGGESALPAPAGAAPAAVVIVLIAPCHGCLLSCSAKKHQSLHGSGEGAAGRRPAIGSGARIDRAA